MSTIDENDEGAPELPEGTHAEHKMSRRHHILRRLYTGTGAFDIVGKRKVWYIGFGAFMLVCLASIIFRWFNLGIEFEGGTRIQMPTQGAVGDVSISHVTEVFNDTLHKEPVVQTVGTGADASIQIKSPTLTADEVNQLKAALFKEFQPKDRASGQPSERVISDSAVSGSWGGEISRSALIALGVFLVLVTIFLAFYFERWMAVAALAALVHDVTVTAGVYSLIGFEVTPATVIGLLTILGFSLYDTVVVFDKVKENTRGLLGLTILVVNDDGGGIFALLEQGAAEHTPSFERVFATPVSADLSALCTGYHVPHTLAHTPSTLRAALSPTPGLHVIEVRPDRTRLRDLHARLRAAITETALR